MASRVWPGRWSQGIPPTGYTIYPRGNVSQNVHISGKYNEEYCFMGSNRVQLGLCLQEGVAYSFRVKEWAKCKPTEPCFMLLLVFCLSYSPTTKIKVIYSNETLGSLWTTEPRSPYCLSLPGEPQIQNITWWFAVMYSVNSRWRLNVLQDCHMLHVYVNHYIQASWYKPYRIWRTFSENYIV